MLGRSKHAQHVSSRELRCSNSIDWQPPRVLIIEDDPHVAQGLVGGLKRAGFEATLAVTGDSGLRQILNDSFDLVLLDLMLPELSGFEVLEAVRSRVSVPIVVLSARTDLPSRLQSFDGGAVDFVPKPFFMEELVARIRTRLSVSITTPNRELLLADVVVDMDARVVRRGDVDLGLTSYEFNVLAFLRERPGRALTRSQIAEGALSDDGDCSDRTVDSHVSRIRKKIGPAAGERLKTVWGIGYRCEKEDA
ncbi:MAG: response regulator transcription factor [Myxococcota bacterium]